MDQPPPLIEGALGPTHPGSPLLAPSCELEALGNGVYERTLGETWWAQASQHGGYVVALAIEALDAQLAVDGRSLLQLTLQYLRPVQRGPVRIEVTTERVGRRLANAAVRVISDGKLAALGLGSVAARSPAGDVALAQAPVVAPYDPAANDLATASTRPIQCRVWTQLRLGVDRGDGPSVTGGWVAPRTPEIIDHRWLAVVSDLLVPAAYRAWDPPRMTSTVDMTFHARAELPTGELPPGSPVLVVLTNEVCAGGFVDESVDIWSPTGVLLSQARQIRIVTAPLERRG